MGINLVKEALALAANSAFPLRQSGGIDEPVIEKCEVWLGCSLPVSYRYFLKEVGRISFASMEIYGFTKDGFEANRAPSFLWVTKMARERGDLQEKEVAIMSSGFGPYFVLATDRIDSAGECPVQLAERSNIDIGETFDNFGIFLLNEVREAIQLEKEEGLDA